MILLFVGEWFFGVFRSLLVMGVCVVWGEGGLDVFLMVWFLNLLGLFLGD